LRVAPRCTRCFALVSFGASLLPVFSLSFFRASFPITRLPPTFTLFPYTTLFRSLFIFLFAIPKFCYSIRLVMLELCFFFSSFRRSEEHTSELQSRFELVCRLLL